MELLNSYNVFVETNLPGHGKSIMQKTIKAVGKDEAEKTAIIQLTRTLGHDWHKYAKIQRISKI